MTIDDIFADVAAELLRAEAKFPGWPRDPVHGTAIIAEESGEAVQAALQFYYKQEATPEKLRKELVQTAAMAVRMLAFMDAHRLSREGQDEQVQHTPLHDA